MGRTALQVESQAAASKNVLFNIRGVTTGAPDTWSKVLQPCDTEHSTSTSSYDDFKWRSTFFPAYFLPWQAPCHIRYDLAPCSWHRGDVKAESWCEPQNTRRGSFGCNVALCTHSLILTQSVPVGDMELSLKTTSPSGLGPALGATLWHPEAGPGMWVMSAPTQINLSPAQEPVSVKKRLVWLLAPGQVKALQEPFSFRSKIQRCLQRRGNSPCWPGTDGPVA